MSRGGGTSGGLAGALLLKGRVKARQVKRAPLRSAPRRSGAMSLLLEEEERARLPAESLSWLLGGTSSGADADAARDVKAATVEEAATSSGSAATAAGTTTLLALARGERLLCVHLFGAKREAGEVRGTFQHSGPAAITSVRWVTLQGGVGGPRLVAGRDDGCLLFLDRHCGVVFESRLHFAPILSIHAHQTKG